MLDIDHLPKSIKKTLRYIKQDAPDHKLKEIKLLVDRAIEERINKNLKSRGVSK